MWLLLVIEYSNGLVGLLRGQRERCEVLKFEWYREQV